MSSELESLKASLELAERRLERERIARKQAETLLLERTLELRRQNDALERRAEHHKEALTHALGERARSLATISHEIRTPLNGIVGMTNLLLETAREEPDLSRIQTLERCAKDLRLLINDYLDLSRLDAGKLALDVGPGLIPDVVQHVVELFRAAAEAKGLFIRASCSGCDVPLLIDAFRLRQILTNLVANAVKFTESGGIVVRVTACGAGDTGLSVKFSVRDTGIGIPPSRVARVFEPFEQAATGTASRFGGTGLGLSIVKGIVTQMGGEIGVDSQPGQGTEFSFTLEVPYASAETSAPVPAAELIRTLDILVVDDNQINALVAQGILTSLGARVVVAHSGREALASIDRVDLLLTDVIMPEMDGVQLARQARDAGFTGPIVALTAGVSTDDETRLGGAGIFHVIAKPIDRTELVETLNRAIQESSAVSKRKW